jgi:hypothetical protein
MVNQNGFGSSSNVKFVVKNNYSSKYLNVLAQSLAPLASIDLMKVPGMTEDDIRSELTKGSLKRLIDAGHLSVLSSTVNLTSPDAAFTAYLTAAGIPSTLTNPTYLSQLTWYIDPVTGVDSNDGASSLTALKTFAELARRWGVFGVLKPSTGSLITVNILNDLPSTDRLSCKISLAANVSVLIKGVATTLATGTLSSVTVKARSTNTALSADFGAAVATFRIDGATPARILNSTTGGVCHVLKAISTNVARLSEPFVPPTLTSTPLTTISNSNRSTAFVDGNTWVAQGLTKVYLGDVEVQQEALFSGGAVAFQDLFFDTLGTVSGMVRGDVLTTSLFYGCIMKSGFALSSETTFMYTSMSGGLSGFGKHARINGCAWFGGLSAHTSGLFIDYDTIFQGGIGSNGITGPNMFLKLGTVGVFDITAASANNAPGAGVYVMAGTTCLMGGGGLFDPSPAGTGHALWGSGNAGAGVEVAPGGSCNYNTNCPTITGAAGDFKLAGATSSRAFDETAGAGAGAYTALISNTWANQVLAVASGGFGEAALNVQKGAKIAKGL